MGNDLSQEALSQKMVTRISLAYNENFLKVLIYFNKPKSQKIVDRLNNMIIYHSRQKITTEHLMQFVNTYQNDQMSINYDNHSESVTVKFLGIQTKPKPKRNIKPLPLTVVTTITSSPTPALTVSHQPSEKLTFAPIEESHLSLTMPKLFNRELYPIKTLAMSEVTKFPSRI